LGILKRGNAISEKVSRFLLVGWVVAEMEEVGMEMG